MSATDIQDSNQSSRQHGAVEAAFAQVLRAEQAARGSIADARLQAMQMAEQARAETRARAERTRRHMAASRAAFERKLQAHLAAIARAADALREEAPLQALDEARVEHAVRRLAAQMTGAMDVDGAKPHGGAP